jgi:predicted acyltransferase
MTTDVKNNRLQSLDALRGFDMLFIMGGAGLLVGLAHWLPCSFTEMLARQMGHVEWNGLAHHDTIFPLFLFIAGISFPFSLEKQRASGRSEFAIHRKVIVRGLMLFLLGLIYNGLLDSFNFAELRYASVLARIGFAWMFAALIFIHTGWRSRAVITAVLLVGYYLVARFIPAPDAAGEDIFTAQGSIIGYVDRILLPGRIYYGNLDPEGILGVIPAIGTALLGMFTGEWVKREDVGQNRKVWGMVLAGVVMLVVGLLWSLDFPINKKMWTSTFVLVVGAYSILMFALFYYIIDVLQWRRWTLFFTVIGMNSITIYLGQRFINFSYTADKIFGGLVRLMPENSQEFFTRAAYIAVCWIFLYFLYKKRIFLKV